MKILITGATGTLGRIIINKLLDRSQVQIVGYSRDEQKQRTMPIHHNLEMVVGDVRDFNSLRRAARDCEVIGHFAALKCVDTMEANPWESVQTNIHGTQNVCEIADLEYRRVVFTSTDKACCAINVYGQSKAIGEALVQKVGGTICRYGNVLGSRGSVLATFVRSLLEKNSVNITSPEMTRFWITADEISEFIIDKLFDPEKSGVWLPEMKAAPVIMLAQAISKCLKIPTFGMNTVGLRPGEKIHETLRIDEKGHDYDMRSDNCEQFTLNEMIDRVASIVDAIHRELIR